MKIIYLQKVFKYIKLIEIENFSCLHCNFSSIQSLSNVCLHFAALNFD